MTPKPIPWWQEHFNDDRYDRYHSEIYVPDEVREGVLAFLPPPYTPLLFSRHYNEIREARRLPNQIYMPPAFIIVDATIVKDTRAVFRASIRFRWTGQRVPRSRQTDLVVVLEGDYEVVTAYWISPWSRRNDLDWSKYQQAPNTDAEAKLEQVLSELPSNA